MPFSKENPPSRLRVPNRGLLLGIAAPVSFLAFLASCGGGDSPQNSFDDQFKPSSQATESFTPLPAATALPTPAFKDTKGDEGITSDHAEIGKLAPDFELPDENGRLIKLSDFAGKPTMLFVYEGHCPPCDRDAQAFRSLINEIGNANLKVITVYTFLQSYGRNIKQLPFELSPVVFDWDDRFTEAYNFYLGWPRTYLVDKAGIIRDIHVATWEYIGLKKTAQMLSNEEEIIPEENLKLDKSLLGLPVYGAEPPKLFSLYITREDYSKYPNLSLDDIDYINLQFREILDSRNRLTGLDSAEFELGRLALAGERLARAYCRNQSVDTTLELLTLIANYATGLFQEYTTNRLLDFSRWPEYASRFNPDCHVDTFPSRN